MARNMPSEVENVEHALVISDKHTRAHLEVLLAFHNDLYAGQSAEEGVECTGDDVVDIISPSYEGKWEGRAEPQGGAKAEAADIENGANVISDEGRCLRETVDEVGGETDISQGLQDE